MELLNQLKSGSKGANVKKVQQWLVDKGYNIGKSGVDGILGKNTESAIKQAQGDNGWKVDGIVGKETWGGMFNEPKKETLEMDLTKPDSQGVKQNLSAENNGASKSGSDTIEQEITSKQPSASVYNPQQDEAYMQALATLQQVQNTAPTYKDSFSGQLQDLYNQIVNRDKFSYDVNSDALYQQYKDQYVQQGKMAMQDTMGQAAALTGGYGSSYAQGVGQQAYQGYLQQLNDRVPELYDRALSQYNQEGQDMLNQYAMLGDMADDEYMKYRDSMTDYYNRLDMARQDVETAYNRGYTSNRDAIGDARYDYEVQHALEREAIEDGRYDTQWEHQLEREGIEDERYNEQWDYQLEQDALDRDYQDRVFGYTQEQDAIKNQQWQDSFDYQKGQDSLNREDSNKANAYNKVMSFIGTDYKPTDSELESAGLTREQYDAVNKYLGSSGTGTQPLENVKSMSSTEIVNAMQGFKDLKDNTGLESFLDDCVASGRMTEAQADEYYKKYGTDLEVGSDVSPQSDSLEQKYNNGTLTYEDVAKYNPGIRTRSEFSRGNNPDKQKYGDYQTYLKAMYEKYKG